MKIMGNLIANSMENEIGAFQFDYIEISIFSINIIIALICGTGDLQYSVSFTLRLFSVNIIHLWVLHMYTLTQGFKTTL